MSMTRQKCHACSVYFDGGPHALYCPACRHERSKAAKLDYHRRTITGEVRRLGSMDVCALCGKTYVVKSGVQKYCRDCMQAEVRAK